MKNYHKLSFILMVALFFNCATQMKVKGDTVTSLQPLKKTETVVVVEENKNLDSSQNPVKLGEFDIKNGGFSIDCDYERVKNLAKNKARSIGGNTVKIIAHKLPSAWSTCHQIKFEVYKMDNIAEFQEDIIWSTDNKLTWDNFKGVPKVDKSSFFCGYIDVQFNDVKFLNGKGEVSIIPIFLLPCSYVQPLKKDKYLLEYNQLKFDLLEFYSRKMRKEFATSEIDTNEKWQKFAKSIYDKIYAEHDTDIFNLETETNFGEDYSALLPWKFKVENDLKTLTEFSTEIY
ncbi:MAG: hypothetical protein KDC97_06105 [Confluentibacter sp.]|nr:hypothetical protein [Confluentibacter sp.]